jgi:hypothetical protein
MLAWPAMKYQPLSEWGKTVGAEGSDAVDSGAGLGVGVASAAWARAAGEMEGSRQSIAENAKRVRVAEFEEKGIIRSLLCLRTMNRMLLWNVKGIVGGSDGVWRYALSVERG